MTEQERLDKFMIEYQKLVAETGFEFGATMQSESLGPVIQVRLIVNPQRVANWQVPEPIAEQTSALRINNGKHS